MKRFKNVLYLKESTVELKSTWGLAHYFVCTEPGTDGSGRGVCFRRIHEDWRKNEHFAVNGEPLQESDTGSGPGSIKGANVCRG